MRARDARGHLLSPTGLVRVTLLLVGLLLATVPTEGAAEIGPADRFCAAVNALEAGGELVLRPGDYEGPCAIRTGGHPGAPVVIRAKDLQHRPRIGYRGSNANVIEVRASHVVIRGLEIGPTESDVDGVRIYAGDDVTVEDCRFTGLQGIAVVANHASVRGLVVRRNVIQDTGATAMYFGCHDGEHCAVSDLVVERNYIHTVRAPDSAVGYGVQVKLNSVAVIRDNVIVDTKGPGIMVYGSRDPLRVSVIERNLVMGSRKSSGIVVGGGPAIVRNNVAVSNREGGIGLEDYGRRGLLRSIVVVHNTLYQNELGGVLASSRGLLGDVIIANNAVASRAGVPALPASRPELSLSGNVDCTRAACFADAEAMNFSPGSALVGRADVQPGFRQWIPANDFFGVPRGARLAIGAIERPAGPVRLGIKP